MPFPIHTITAHVRYPVTTLVSTLAGQYGLVTHVDANGRSTDLSDMIEQAFELASTVLDYEAAAREAGAEFVEGNEAFRSGQGAIVTTWFSTLREAAEEYCILAGIEPHEREVFEHWIVTDWLADKLEEAGEKVDRDFAGMTVWAKTRQPGEGSELADCAVLQRIAAES